MDGFGIVIIVMAVIYLIIQIVSEEKKMKKTRKVSEQIFSGIVSSAILSCVGMEQAAGVEKA